MTQKEKNIAIKKRMEKIYKKNWQTIWQEYSRPLLCDYFRQSGGRCVQCGKFWCNVQTFKAVAFNVERLICCKCKKRLNRKKQWWNKCDECQRECQRLQAINNKGVCDTCYVNEVYANV